MSVLTDLKKRYLANERKILRTALVGAGWRLPQSAKVLGTSLSSLYRALQRHPELDAERRKARGLGAA